MPFVSGRKSGYERNEFEAIYIEVDDMKQKVSTKEKCKHCGDEVSNKVERLRQHLLKCRHYKSLQPIVKKRNISLVENDNEENYLNIHLHGNQVEEQTEHYSNIQSTSTKGSESEPCNFIDFKHKGHFMQKTHKEHK